MTNITNGEQFSSGKLAEALFTIEDLMDQLLTSYFLHEMTAWHVKHNELLSGDGIDVLIRDTACTQYVYDILADRLKLTPEQVKNGFEYNAVNGVPIRIKVYKRNYQFFKYPDHVVYNFGTYQIANPFELYWKSRGLIQ